MLALFTRLEFCLFIVLNLLVHYGCSSLVFPRPIPTKSFLNRNIYRRIRKDDVSVLHPSRQPLSNFSNLNSFEDVVAAFVSRLNANSTSIVTNAFLNKTSDKLITGKSFGGSPNTTFVHVASNTAVATSSVMEEETQFVTSVVNRRSDSVTTPPYFALNSSTVQYSHSAHDPFSSPSVPDERLSSSTPKNSNSEPADDALIVINGTSIFHRIPDDNSFSSFKTSSDSSRRSLSEESSGDSLTFDANSAISTNASKTVLFTTTSAPTLHRYSTVETYIHTVVNSVRSSTARSNVFSSSTLFPNMSNPLDTTTESFLSTREVEYSNVYLPVASPKQISTKTEVKDEVANFTYSYGMFSFSSTSEPEISSEDKLAQGLTNQAGIVGSSFRFSTKNSSLHSYNPAIESRENSTSTSSTPIHTNSNLDGGNVASSSPGPNFYFREFTPVRAVDNRSNDSASKSKFPFMPTVNESIPRLTTSIPSSINNDYSHSNLKHFHTDSVQNSGRSRPDYGVSSTSRYFESAQTTTLSSNNLLSSSTSSYRNKSHKPKPTRNFNVRKPLHTDSPLKFTTYRTKGIPGIVFKKTTDSQILSTMSSPVSKKQSSVANTGMKSNNNTSNVSIKNKSGENLPDFSDVSRSSSAAKIVTTSTTTTTPYPPQNDVPWHSEHHNIPMSDSKEDADVVFKIKKFEDDPFIEPPIPFAEPGPEWKKAKKQWGVAWELHIYLTGSLFAVISIYSALSTFRLLMMHNLQSRGYFISLNFMMFVMGLTRAIYLMHDAYNSSNAYPPILSYFLFNISNPCLTSSFAILFLALLEATKLRLLPPRIQKPAILVGIVTFHFSFSTATDVIAGSILGAKFLLFVCHLVSLIWAALLSLGYFYIYRKLYKSALRKQGELIRITFTRLHIDGGDLPKRLPKARLGLAVKVTLATAILAFLMALTQLYGMVCIFDYFSFKRPDPWPWWSFHFVCRLLELFMCATMSFIATQPVRHFNAASTPACVTTAWIPCSVFVGCTCSRKDPMMTYSNSCLTHHSFRNPGFSSTLDTPRRNWEQTSFQPQLQAVTLERKDLSLITDESKSKSNSLQSLNSIKKSVICVDVDSCETKNDNAVSDEDIKVASLARSTKSEKASMLYRENGFVRFRMEEDPEQPMEDSDGEGEDHEDSADDRFSTMATAGSVVHSISDEDHFQKAVFELCHSGYWSPRARRLSRASMDTTLESGLNSSIDYLNNLVFVKAGMSNSAQEIPVCRYGSTCSSESAGNSFDVYLHDAVRSSRQNSSSSNLNCGAKRRIKNNAPGNSHHRESFLSSSDNDNNDLIYDLTSEDCATRSLLSQGEVEEATSKNGEDSFTSPCCHSHNDCNSSASSCNNCKTPFSSKCKSFDDAVRNNYLVSVIPMLKVDLESSATTSSFKTEKSSPPSSALKTHVSLPSFQNERGCVFTKIDEDSVDETLNCTKEFSGGIRGIIQNPKTKRENKGVTAGPKLVHLYQKAGKSHSVGDLSKFPAHWETSTKSKKAPRNIWQKLRGSTFSLNSSLQGYEPLTTEDGPPTKRCGSDVTIQRSFSDRRPQATSTVKSLRKIYDRDKLECNLKTPMEYPRPYGNRFCSEGVLGTGHDCKFVLDLDRCSHTSDVSV